jgi:hypothetical protein
MSNRWSDFGLVARKNEHPRQHGHGCTGALCMAARAQAERTSAMAEQSLSMVALRMPATLMRPERTA